MVRTRFAPSPTGFLHIGGARTALFCWLYARKMKGQFILRIEDTDLERSTESSVQAILDAMEWLKLNCDEGPFFQTQRFQRYKEVADELLQKDKAYRCYCSKERLEALRAAQIERKEKPRYDGHCRDITEIKDQAFVIRFKNPREGKVEFHDLIRGDLSFANAELDDLILVRSDGSPTYNFTVVVDDWDMKITHVIRGDDHINNTPRQINILTALDATIPLYAHVPMILGSDGKRLSKRHGAVSVMQYRDEGYLPESLINYLVRLGWSHGDQEIFSIDELINYFDIADVNRASAAFNPEKLLWINHHYIKTMNPDELARRLTWYLEKLSIDVSQGPDLVQVVLLQRERTKTLIEMAARSQFFYQDVLLTEEMQASFDKETQNIVRFVRDQLQSLSEWSVSAIHGLLQAAASHFELKLGKIAAPIRLAVTGAPISPPLDQTLFLLGREKCVLRLNAAAPG